VCCGHRLSQIAINCILCVNGRTTYKLHQLCVELKIGGRTRRQIRKKSFIPHGLTECQCLRKCEAAQVFDPSLGVKGPWQDPCKIQSKIWTGEIVVDSACLSAHNLPVRAGFCVSCPQPKPSQNRAESKLPRLLFAVRTAGFASRCFLSSFVWVW
jgi:hypothetical protein